MHLFRHFAVFLCATLAAYAGDAPRKLAFSRGDAIYVANLDGTAPKKIASGTWPKISPDGTRVAFNTQAEKTPERHIAIADVATGKTNVLPGIPSDNSFGPIWSPDGSKLIFSTMANHEWRLAFIDADGSHFHYFEPKVKIGTAGLNSVAWTPDGESFYAQDLDTLYHFGLDGTVKDKRPVEKLIPNASFSGGQQFSVSADGHTLLVDADMNENSRKDWDGPPPAVWTLDLSSAKPTRITPKGFYGWSPAWVSDTEILCNVQPEKSRQRSIYRLSIDGKKRELVVKNAESPSVSK